MCITSKNIENTENEGSDLVVDEDMRIADVRINTPEILE